MLTPSLSTYTGAVVNRVEDWSTPRPSASWAHHLFPSTLIGAVGISTVAAVECVTSGLHFLVLFAPVVVKKTLELFRLHRLSGAIPEIGFGSLWILARKTVALALEAIFGGVLVLWQPETAIHFYDALGLKRHVSLVAPNNWKEFWRTLGLLVGEVAAEARRGALVAYDWTRCHPRVSFGLGAAMVTWILYRSLFSFSTTVENPLKISETLPSEEETAPLISEGQIELWQKRAEDLSMRAWVIFDREIYSHPDGVPRFLFLGTIQILVTAALCECRRR